MPLSKERMKARKRLDRAVKPASNPNPVKPTVSELQGVIDKMESEVPVQPQRLFVLHPEQRKDLEGVEGFDADGYPIYED